MEVNRHHTVFMRRNYTTQVERAFRNHQGLIVPIFIPIHNELHANVEPPQKPSRDSMLGALALLNGLPAETDRLESVERVADYMIKRHQRIGHCLLEQLPFLEDGIARPRLLVGVGGD